MDTRNPAAVSADTRWDTHHHITARSAMDDAQARAQAQWERFLRTSGVNWYAVGPDVQAQLTAQFAAWQRRQAVIGKVILGVIAFVVVVAALVVATTMWL